MRQPGIGAAGVSAEPDRTEAYLTFTSFNHPTAIFRVDLAKPAAEPELWEQPDVPVDPSIVDVEQVWYPSKDGTKISMFLVHKKGLVKDGRTPTLLNGYGGFNVSETPVFSATLFQWFEAGGLFALPNLRGGGEYGDAWHEAGMLDRKQNMFDDFIAAAEWLIAQGYTHAGSTGDSRRIERRPAHRRGDHAAARSVSRRGRREVPLLDMLRYQDFLMARYWVPEYGSAEKADQFKFLLAYSPYHHVKAGHEVPGRVSHGRRARHACPRDARAQDGGAASGRDGLRSRRTARAALGRSRRRTRTGQAAQPASCAMSSISARS